MYIHMYTYKHIYTGGGPDGDFNANEYSKNLRK